MTRRWAFASAMVVVIMCIGLLIQRVWLEREPVAARVEEPVITAEAPPDVTPEIALRAHVDAAEGVSEVYDSKDGRWRPLVTGEELSGDAVLRTQSGHVGLRIGETIRVEISQFSQFRLNELTNRLSTVRLEQGLVTADVAPSEDGELVLEVLGSEVEARTKDGNFSVLRGKEGHVTVAGRRGTVGLHSAGKSVVVEPGQQSSVAPGKAPSAPATIPGELLIKLTQGHSRKQRYRTSRIEGQTASGAVVTVNGIETSAPDGHFSVTVPLSEGTNSLTVISRDAMGREKKQVVTGIEVDTSPPPARGKVKW